MTALSNHHCVEKSFGSFVVSIGIDTLLALPCGAHVSQSDACRMSWGDSLHALSCRVHGEQIQACIGSSVDAETMVVGVKQVAVIAAPAATVLA